MCGLTKIVKMPPSGRQDELRRHTPEKFKGVKRLLGDRPKNRDISKKFSTEAIREPGNFTKVMQFNQ